LRPSPPYGGNRPSTTAPKSGPLRLIPKLLVPGPSWPFACQRRLSRPSAPNRPWLIGALNTSDPASRDRRSDFLRKLSGTANVSAEPSWARRRGTDGRAATVGWPILAGLRADDGQLRERPNDWANRRPSPVREARPDRAFRHSSRQSRPARSVGGRTAMNATKTSLVKRERTLR
jgi:hypothetical protein